MVWRFFFLLSISITVWGQPSPEETRWSSLRSAIRSSNPDSISYYLSVLGSYHFRQQNYDSSNYYYQRALQHNRLSGKTVSMAGNLNDLGVLHFRKGSLDSSIYFYNKAYDEYQILGDTARISILEINLGVLYKQKGLYEKSLEYLLSASHKLEKGEASPNLAICYNSIGNVYSKIGELYDALDFHGKALAVRQKLNLQRGIASSHNNIGNVYALLEQYDSALLNFKKSLEIKRLLQDKGGEGTSLNNIGELMIRVGRLDDAQDFLKEALSIRLKEKDKVGEVITRNNLAHVSLLKDFVATAAHNLRVSEEMALSLGLLEQLKDNYELQVLLHRKRGNLNTALDYSEKLLAVKDELLNQEKAQTLAEMQTRYESMKKEDRIALLEKEGLLQAVELDRKQIWIRSLVLAMVLIVIIGVLIYYNLRTVRRNKVHIELLLKELHHRVKNNLQILSSLLSLQSQQLTDDTAIKAVKSSESRINAMALIHRKLYTVDKNRTVDIKEYITELIQYLVYSYGYHEKNFKLDLEIREISIDVDKAIPLGLILNELISNAFKHAYENQPNPRLMVNLVYPEADHELSIRIMDNGTGMPAVDEKQRKTFGMKIVSTLIKELKGSLNVKSENGTVYDLHIPI